ncbi:MAG: hypothetical protein ABIF11_11095 [Nitrospirota bacterium]
MASVTVQVNKDESILIPQNFIKRYGWVPREKIEIFEERKGLRITKECIYDKFIQLLQEGLSGVDWKEIEKGREDRCF